MITPTDSAAAANATQANSEKTQKSAAAAAGDFENFLSLLTAQLRHQDPLSPLDSTQFVEQLASFSSVEQQIETNRLLEQLVGGGGDSSLESATAWIGKEIEVETDAARFAGDPLDFSIPARADATPAEFIIRDRSGSVVYRETLTAGQTSFTWNGQNSDGNTAPEGDYRFSVDYATKDGASETGAPRTTSLVTEARLVDGALRLVLENGGVVDPATATAVRAADQTS